MSHRSFLLETAPYCPTAECYVHGMAWRNAEHHVAGCPVGDTVIGHMHRMEHGIQDVQAVIGNAFFPILDDVAAELRALLPKRRFPKLRAYLSTVRASLRW